jgi:hypothetical protein
VRIGWIIFFRSFVLGSERTSGNAQFIRFVFLIHSFSQSFFCLSLLSFAFSSRFFVTNLDTTLVFRGPSGCIRGNYSSETLSKSANRS